MATETVKYSFTPACVPHRDAASLLPALPFQIEGRR